MVRRSNDDRGYSLVELIVAMLLSLIILGGAVVIFSKALGTWERESDRVDAITSAQAALSVMSREIGNAGFGLDSDNGLILADCGAKRLRYRTNVVNSDGVTSSPAEDVTYLYDSGSQSVVRFDRNANGGAGVTSGIINRVSDVDFVFHNYASDGSFTSGTTASATTGRVTINLYIMLPDAPGQPPGRVERVASDVTLRNSAYMLGQY